MGKLYQSLAQIVLQNCHQEVVGIVVAKWCNLSVDSLARVVPLQITRPSAAIKLCGNPTKCGPKCALLFRNITRGAPISANKLFGWYT